MKIQRNQCTYFKTVLVFFFASSALFNCGSPVGVNDAGDGSTSDTGNVDTGDTGNVDTGADDADSHPGTRHFPLEVDATWTYSLFIDQTTSVTINHEVEAFEAIGSSKLGVTAYRLKLGQPGGSYCTDWREDLGDRVVSHGGSCYDTEQNEITREWHSPFELIFDETRTMEGETWTETYTTTQEIEGNTTTTSREWTLESLEDTITVPAGTFICRRFSVRLGTDDPEILWFAPGVGKVRQDYPAGLRLELTSYSIP